MKKCKVRWFALFSGLLLLCSFLFAACDNGAEKAELGELRDIFIVTNELKTTYEVGDTFDYSAVKIRAVYTNGEENLTAADEDKGVTHTDLDMTTAGDKTLTVTYKAKEASVGITVREKQKAVLKGLQLSKGKTFYQVGDEIDYHTFELTAIFSIGNDVTLYGDSEEITRNPASVSTDAAGTTPVTFSYTADGVVTKSVTVDIVVSASPLEKTLISIEVQSTAADRTVEYGGTVDYSKFIIVCHYSDGSTNTEPLNGTSAGVTHNEIVTTNAGEYELTFTYESKSATVPITVLPQKDVITLNRFALPTFYTAAAAVADDEAGTQSQNRDIFMKGFETYKVGDDNAFEFQPDATILISTTQEVPVTVRTTFTLEKKGDGDSYEPVSDVATYVTTEPLLPNYYYFTEEAVGKVFKLTIKPDAESYTVKDNSDTIEAIIEVVDGYNVYNQIGLSVFDNLNVKHWAKIKGDAGTLRWDSKPLTEYNTISGDDAAPVKNVVLHGDITIDPDQLPDSYFWKEGESVGSSSYKTVNDILKGNSHIPDSVKNYLDGSLKDGLNKDQWYKFDDSTSGDLEEDAKTSVNMQKGVYVSTGTGIEGNFHEITYHTSGTKHSLYTVYDGKTSTGSAFPLSHWSLFKYGNETTANVTIVNGGEPHVSDLRILGQSPRLAATNGEPAHLMAFNSCTNTMSLENCIVSRLFVVVLGDEASSGVNVSDSKLFDIYSNMFYLWRAKIDVKNSIMKDAGGPIFILCDGNRVDHSKDQYAFSMWTMDEEGPRLVVDDASVLESKAAGNESWYVLNGVNAMFGQIKGNGGDPAKGTSGLGDAARGYLGREVLIKENGTDFVNVVAVIIPEPSLLSTSKPFKESATTAGMATIGSEVFKMHPVTPGFNQMMASAALQVFYSSNAPYFISEGKTAIYGATSMSGLDASKYGFHDVVATTTGTAKGDWAFTAAETKAAWNSVTSPYLFLSMRVSAKMSGFSVTEATPRIGILVGSVTKAGA